VAPVKARIRLARLAETAARFVGAAVVFGIVAVAVFVVAYLLYRGASAISLEFLTRPPRNAMRAGGIMPAIVGTFYLVLGTALFALPVGIAAGVYLAEYAPKGRTSRFIRLAIANMAGVPSIVYGIFGVAAFVYIAGFGQSILAGSLTLACLTLPVVITATEEALRQVPRDLRQASLALGASRLRTTFRIVLPAALPGVVTGSLLGLSRAAGETAPILFTAAVFFAPRLPTSPLSPVMALPYHLYVMLTQVPPSPATDKMAWGTALVLVVGVSIVNVTAAAWRSVRRRKVRW
jgi:phosphate transport system permease protein